MNQFSDPLGAQALKAIKTVKMSAASVLEGIGVEMDPLHIDEIPVSMDKMGWTVSAQMMRRWFATRPGYAMPAAIRGGEYAPGVAVDYARLAKTQVDDAIIKMKWLMGFPRVAAACQALSLQWKSPKAISRLKGFLLPAAGWRPGLSMSLGHTGWGAIQLDAVSQTNYQIVGGYSDEVDDLYGAVFKANLKVAIVGHAYYSASHQKDVFEATKLGIYLRDTYDFNGDAMMDKLIGLGVWSREKTLGKLEAADYLSATFIRRAMVYPGFVPLRNQDFNNWRTTHGSGGDYFVFSDVLWIDPVDRFVQL